MSFVTNAASRAGKRARMYGNGLGQQSSNMAGGNLAPFATSTSTRTAGQVYSSLSLGSSTTNGITIHGPNRNPYASNPNGTEKITGDGVALGGFRNFDIAYVGLGVLRFASFVSIPNIVDDVAIKGSLTVEENFTINGTTTFNGSTTIDPLKTNNIVINGTDSIANPSSLWADNTLGEISIGANNEHIVSIGDVLVDPPVLDVIIGGQTSVTGDLTVYGDFHAQNVSDTVQMFPNHASDNILIGNASSGTANVGLQSFNGTAELRTYGTGSARLQSNLGSIVVSTTKAEISHGAEILLDNTGSGGITLTQTGPLGSINITNNTGGGGMTISNSGTTPLAITSNTALNLTSSNNDINLTGGSDVVITSSTGKTEVNATTGNVELTAGNDVIVTAAVGQDIQMHPTQTTGNVDIGNASATTGTVNTLSELRPAAGISFDSGSNVMNFYATGTFLPGIRDASTAATYNILNQQGKYVRIGQLVMYTLTIEWTSQGAATGTNVVELYGFPFTSTGDVTFDTKYMSIPANSSGFNLAANEHPSFQMTKFTSTMQGRKMNPDNGGRASMVVNDTQLSGFIIMTGTYICQP